MKTLSIELHLESGYRPGETVADFLGKADRYRFVHPGWLSMIWRAVASGWAKRRREREIKRAVAALADYDDRCYWIWEFPIDRRSSRS